MTIKQAAFHAFSLVRLSDSLGAYNTSRVIDTQNLLEQIQTIQHDIINLKSPFLNRRFFIIFSSLFQYFALMLLLLLMELGVAIYLYIEKDKVKMS